MNEMSDAAAEKFSRQSMREELIFVRAYIASRLAAGANPVSVLRSMASAVGQSTAQLPQPFPTKHGVAMMMFELQRSAAVIMSMSPEELRAAGASLNDG